MSSHSQPGSLTIDETIDGLVARAEALISGGRRRILGVIGTPGAGKSTVSSALAEALGDSIAVVGMDGFHLANQELIRLGRRDRKGAPDTFDVGGYVSLLRRLRDQNEDVVYAPVFDRGLEESIGSAYPVAKSATLILTEGNYLLHDQLGWQAVRDQLDETWFLDIAAEERQDRLVKRRQSFGDSIEEARSWVLAVDEVNAAIVEKSRVRADLVVRVLF